jgi:hypothetical protein
MITPKTTFIVGAGGSDPYGLPVASSLCASARNLQPSSDIYRLLEQVLDGNNRLLDDFVKDLCGHPAGSIDAFLEQRQHQPDTMRVGKLLIAALMGQAIAERKSAPHYEGDWIRHIIVHMSRGTRRAADFANTAQNVNFITFNFDSVIEERSAQLLQGIYNGDDGLMTAIRAICVTHIHGHLRPPPKDQIRRAEPNADRNMETIDPKWVEWTKNSAAQVRVVLDDIDDSLLNRVREIVKTSKIVCFLGFGYEKGNIDKFGFPPEQRESVEVFGSAYGLTHAQRHQAEERISVPNRHLSLAGPGDKCLDVLRNYHVLRD